MEGERSLVDVGGVLRGTTRSLGDATPNTEPKVRKVFRLAFATRVRVARGECVHFYTATVYESREYLNLFNSPVGTRRISTSAQLRNRDYKCRRVARRAEFVAEIGIGQRHAFATLRRLLRPCEKRFSRVSIVLSYSHDQEILFIRRMYVPSASFLDFFSRHVYRAIANSIRSRTCM